MRVFEASLKEALGNAIAIEFTENIATTGRKVADLLTLVETGELDLCYFSSSYLTGRVPALGVFDIPFELTDRNRTRALLQGPLGARLADEIASRTGYKLLGCWDNGLRNISNRLRPIRMPEDCKGLRIRTLPSDGYHAAFRALGMEPITIDIRDFVAAIASQTVDAQENPLTNLRQFGLETYHRHVTMTRHFHGIALLLCNAKMWGACTPYVREALADAAAQATEAQWEFADAGRAAIACRTGGRRCPDRRSRRHRTDRIPRRGAPSRRAAYHAELPAGLAALMQAAR